MTDAVGQTMTERLKAWWHGYDVDAEDLPEPAAPVAADYSEDQPQPQTTAWTEARAAAVQRLFGPGEDAPQASARTERMIKPLGLDEKMSVLELGCGMGVGLRAVARKSGAWIDGVEPSEALVAEATKWIGTEGLQKKAVPLNCEPNDKAVTKTRRDVILSREALHRFADRDDVLTALREIMKPQAQLLYTDFMIDPDADQSEVERWCAMHPQPPLLTDLAAAKQQIGDLGLDLRVAKDETDEFAAIVLAEMQRFAVDLKRNPVGADMLPWVLWEVEYWARTFGALSSGGLRFCRIHAVSSSIEAD